MDELITHIACDESGAEGETLMSAAHRVFAHASVDLSTDEALEVIREMRSRVPSQAPEFKSKQVLRESRADDLLWLLAPDGPVAGRAVVYLVDKQYFVVGKVIDLLVEEVAHARGEDLYYDMEARRQALVLHREGKRALGETEWNALLGAFNSLMRLTQRKGIKATVDDFFEVIERLRFRSTRAPVSNILDTVWKSRVHAEEFQQRLVEDPETLPALDPLVAALAQTIRAWAERTRRRVRVTHDRQAMLTSRRTELLIEGLRRPLPELAARVPPVSVVAIDQVDSASDPRVQVADLLAGAGRTAALAALDGAADRRLAEALRPYVDEWSLWSDDRSWRTLTGRPAVGAP